MSNNNNDNSAAIGLGLVAVVVMFAAMIIYALAVFLAAALTILSLCARDKPVRAFGKTLCTPLEARIFIGSGFAGAVGLCIFAALCAVLFNGRIEDEWWFYLITGGYSFVSLLVMMTIGQHYPDGLPDDPDYQRNVIEHDPAPAPVATLQAPTPFQYASWDDEADESIPEKPECRGCARNNEAPPPSFEVPPR